MLIECTFCKAKARLPESQEGAKVRCGACGKVYVARASGPGGKRASGSSQSGLRLGLVLGGALAVLLLVVFLMSRPPPPPPKVQVAQEKPEEMTLEERIGWNSAPVLAVREVYAAVEIHSATRLAGRLHSPGILAQVAARDPEGGHPDPATTTKLEADGWLQEYVPRLLEDRGEDAPGSWKPFDGSVIDEGDRSAVVRVQVDPRVPAEGVSSRTYDWKLVLDGEKWKAASWERHISEDERKSNLIARQKEIQKVTLEDGSVLYVAEPRPLPHLEDTPPELRARIDAAMQRMLDFDLPPRDNNRARDELIAIGRPALPILLTGLYETRIVDDDTASKVNMIDIALKDITGDNMGYSPSTALGVSEERREAAVKAWFAWWLRRGERFRERKESEDALDSLLKPKTERDRRELERAKQQSDTGS